MKIIIVGTAYPLRGAFAQLNATLAWHLSKKHDVEIVSFKRQYPNFLFPGKTQIDPGKPLYNVPITPIIDSLNPFSWMATVRYIQAQRPDAVIFRYWLPFLGACFGFIASGVKRTTRAKILYLCDNIVPHEHRFGDRALTRYAFRNVDRFLVHSRTVEQDLRNCVADPHYAQAPLPVGDTFGKQLSKQQARKLLGVHEKNVILFFGYIRRYKGLQHLLAAMPMILSKRKVKLLVVGEFYDEEEDYRKQIADLKIAQHVLIKSDYIANEEVAKYFSACDVAVLPYVSATQSAVVPVAFYFHRPVITTNVGGLPEDVENGQTGVIVPPGRPDALANAVLDFYKNKRERRFGAKITKAKKRHSWGNYVATIEKLMKE